MGDVVAYERDGREPDSDGRAASGDAASTMFGAELAQARRKAGLTQRDLADRLDVRLWTIDQWEAGVKPIPQEMLERIAAAIGTPAVERLSALLASADAAGDDASPSLTAHEIRDAVLPRSLRGYDEAATRRLLGDVAAAYERNMRQCAELRTQVEEMEAAGIDPETHEHVVAERDALRRRADELTAELAERESAAAPAGEQEELRRRVEELEQALAEYAESEQALSRALVAASRAGEELTKEAKAEAKAILGQARRSAAEIQRDIEARREAFDSERESILEELKRQALASAHDDLVALEHAAKPIFDALDAFEDRLRAMTPAGEEGTGQPELLDALKAQQPGGDA